MLILPVELQRHGLFFALHNPSQHCPSLPMPPKSGAIPPILRKCPPLYSMFVAQKAQIAPTGIQPVAVTAITIRMDWKILLIGAFAGYKLLTKAGIAAYEQIEWRFDKPRPADLHLLKRTVDLRLIVKNNLPASITLKRYYGEIFQNGQLLATINSTGTLDLPSGAEKTIQAEAVFKLKDLTSLRLKNPVEVKSYLETSVITIPIVNTIHLGYYVE